MEQQEPKAKEKKKKSMTEEDLDGGKRNKAMDFEDVLQEKFNTQYSSKRKSTKNKLDNLDNPTSQVENSSKTNNNDKNYPMKNSSQNNNNNNNINIE